MSILLTNKAPVKRLRQSVKMVAGKRGLVIFPVSNIVLNAQTWGASYGQDLPDNFPVIYLNADYDYEGYVESAGFPEINAEAAAFLNQHEFRVYINGPLQSGDEFVESTIAETSPDLFTNNPYFQDIPVVPGQTYRIQLSVYNTDIEQESERLEFVYNAPVFEKPQNVRVERFAGLDLLLWDYPSTFPMSGAISDDGPGTWRVTANGRELDRFAGGNGPGAPAQLLTGVVDFETEDTFVVTPVFEDYEGNMYEYEPSDELNFVPPADGLQWNMSDPDPTLTVL